MICNSSPGVVVPMPTRSFKASMVKVLESIFKALATEGNVQVEAAPAERFKAPAEVRDKVPEVVVDKVKGPEPTVMVKPPVEGPVIVLAVVPEKVRLLPKVVTPVTPKVEDKVVAPEADKVVKAPLEGVVAPIETPLMAFVQEGAAAPLAIKR